MAAAAITPRSFDTAFIPASLPGVSFIHPPVILFDTILNHGCESVAMRRCPSGRVGDPPPHKQVIAAKPAFRAGSAAWRSATGFLVAPSTSSLRAERRRTPGVPP